MRLRASTAAVCAIAAMLGGALARPRVVAAEAPAMDAEVAKGIAEVDNGEYDSAILRLDAAARRLAGQPGGRDDLVQAYVYLAVAYLAKGHETSAKNRFRDALALDRALRLSPEKFGPRVVELFEKARDEMAPAPAASPSPTAHEGGGGKKGLLIVALGGAAAAGAAVALGGGGGGGRAAASPAPDTGGLGTLLQQTFVGLTPGRNQFFDVNVRATGTLQVSLDWTTVGHDLDLYLSTPACGDTSRYPPDVCTILARAESPTTKPEVLQSPVTPGVYRIVVSWCGDAACGTGTESGTVQAILRAP